MGQAWPLTKPKQTDHSKGAEMHSEVRKDFTGTSPVPSVYMSLVPVYLASYRNEANSGTRIPYTGVRSKANHSPD